MALAFMRRHRRWLYVFLWIVILAFIVLYFPDFTGSRSGNGAGQAVAEVGGREISAGEFQRAYVQQRQRLERMYQGKINPAMLRSIEEGVLNALVDREIVRLEAERLGLSIDDETLARAIATAPQFQRDGQFVGADELRRLAEMRGVPLAELENEFREGLLRERLEALVGDAVSVSDQDAEREYRRRHEQVKLEYVQVSAAASRAGLSASDAEADARFKQNPEAYRLPERRIAAYVVVDPTALRSSVSVTPAQIESYYRDHAEEFREEEQVCASHILVKVKATAEATEGHSEDEARKLAEGVLQQARGGADFAELAKKSSEDQGSAPSGGDLGCFGRGRMVPEFENAAFDLAPGALSDLVRSPYGFHIIRVSVHKQESLPALKVVEERIRVEVTEERVQELAAEKAATVEAGLRAGRALAQVAGDQGLALEKTAPFARGETPAPLTPVLGARAFELGVGASDPQGARTGRGQAFVELAEIQPPRLPEAAEVRERIKRELVEERALQAARDKAAALLAQAEKDGLEKAATALGLVRKETPTRVGRGQPLGDLGSSSALDAAAFTLAEKTLSQPLRTPAGWALVRVLERTAFDAAAFANEKDQLVSQLRADRRSRVFDAFLQQARRRYRVERHAEVFRRVVG